MRILTTILLAAHLLALASTAKPATEPAQKDRGPVIEASGVSVFTGVEGRKSLQLYSPQAAGPSHVRTSDVPEPGSWSSPITYWPSSSRRVGTVLRL